MDKEKELPQFVSGAETTKILGVHVRTLYQWNKKGWIDTIRTNGNKRLYNVQKYLKEKICKKDTK